MCGYFYCDICFLLFIFTEDDNTWLGGYSNWRNHYQWLEQLSSYGICILIHDWFWKPEGLVLYYKIKGWLKCRSILRHSYKSLFAYIERTFRHFLLHPVWLCNGFGIGNKHCLHKIIVPVALEWLIHYCIKSFYSHFINANNSTNAVVNRNRNTNRISLHGIFTIGTCFQP